MFAFDRRGGEIRTGKIAEQLAQFGEHGVIVMRAGCSIGSDGDAARLLQREQRRMMRRHCVHRRFAIDCRRRERHRLAGGQIGKVALTLEWIARQRNAAACLRLTKRSPIDRHAGEPEPAERSRERFVFVRVFGDRMHDLVARGFRRMLTRQLRERLAGADFEQARNLPSRETRDGIDETHGRAQMVAPNIADRSLAPRSGIRRSRRRRSAAPAR